MALGQKEVVPLAMFLDRVVNCAIFAPRGSFSNIVLFFFVANRKFVRFNILKKIVQRFLEIPPTCTEERLEGNETLKEK